MFREKEIIIIIIFFRPHNTFRHIDYKFRTIGQLSTMLARYWKVIRNNIIFFHFIFKLNLLKYNAFRKGIREIAGMAN